MARKSLSYEALYSAIRAHTTTSQAHTLTDVVWEAMGGSESKSGEWAGDRLKSYDGGKGPVTMVEEEAPDGVDSGEMRTQHSEPVGENANARAAGERVEKMVAPASASSKK